MKERPVPNQSAKNKVIQYPEDFKRFSESSFQAKPSDEAKESKEVTVSTSSSLTIEDLSVATKSDEDPDEVQRQTERNCHVAQSALMPSPETAPYHLFHRVKCRRIIVKDVAYTTYVLIQPCLSDC